MKQISKAVSILCPYHKLAIFLNNDFENRFRITFLSNQHFWFMQIIVYFSLNIQNSYLLKVTSNKPLINLSA